MPHYSLINLDPVVYRFTMTSLFKCLAIATSLTLASFTASAEQLSIDRIFSAPSLSGQTPNSLQFSPDGSRVTYLQGKQENLHRYDLWEYNLSTKENRLLVDSDDIFAGTETLSDEEKARRERQRVYGSGIMEYTFSNDGKALLFPLNGDVYYYSLINKSAKRLTQTLAFETDVKFSPKGNFVSFVREQNLFIINIESGKETKLTKDGGGVIKNGMSEFVAQEEMDRMTGYWWSPDEKHLAFLRVDESPVQVAIRNEIYAEDIKLIEQRYPATGTNNVIIQLATVDVKGKKIRFIDIGENEDIYIPRVKWMPDSKHLTYQWQSRDQKTLALKSYNIIKRRQNTLLTETSDHWINLHKDLRFLSDGSFIWASERDGYKHLYHYSKKGELISQLTKGEWVVDRLKSVDEENGWVYFTGRADTPLERHLYKTPLSGKSPEHVVRVTKRNGFHNVFIANDNKTYINDYSSISQPKQVSLHKISGEHLTWLSENKLDENHPISPFLSQWVTPQFGSLKADDGETNLYYKLHKPQDIAPGKKYPVIVRVYGGPIAQRVTNQWSSSEYITQYLVQQGYVVFQLDNRGSNYRGTGFEFPIYEHLGEVEVTDQITGVKYLHTLDYVDQERIGIYGHSYGGYMALMTMFKAGDYFKAGVSGAPVTDWMLYDTHYTERYLNHPSANASGYEKSSVFPFIDGLSGPLLVYHGMADDNVLFTNTTKLIKSMQDKNKQFELMTYPGSKHSMRGKPVKVHLNNTIVNFFNRHFK